MAHETTPRHLPADPDHPLDLFVPRKIELLLINEVNFPAFLAAHPEYERSDDTSYFTWRFRSEPLKLTELITTGDETPIGELVFKQFLSQYPSREVFETPALPHGKIKEGDKGNRGLWVTERDMVLRQTSGKKPSESDVAWEFGAQTTTTDYETNKYLALRIITGNAVKNPADLEKKSKPGLSVDYELLRNGFLSLVSGKTARLVRSLPQYKSVSADRWLTGIATWVSYCNEQLLRATGDRPFDPIPIQADFYPEIEFIPYMLEAHVSMIERLVAGNEHQNPSLARQLVLMTKTLIGMDQEAIYDRILYYHLLRTVGSLGENHDSMGDAIHGLFAVASEEERNRIIALQSPVELFSNHLVTTVENLLIPAQRSDTKVNPEAMKKKTERLTRDTTIVIGQAHPLMTHLVADNFY